MKWLLFSRKCLPFSRLVRICDDGIIAFCIWHFYTLYFENETISLWKTCFSRGHFIIDSINSDHILRIFIQLFVFIQFSVLWPLQTKTEMQDCAVYNLKKYAIFWQPKLIGERSWFINFARISWRDCNIFAWWSNRNGCLTVQCVFNSGKNINLLGSE